ncbi:NAD-dependent succinate-semialdehyde dehydrogenase [Clostridium sp.]
MKIGEIKNLINGKLVDGRGKLMKVYNPCTGEVLKEFSSVSPEQAVLALESAQTAFESWSKLTIAQREKYILKFASALEENRDSIIDMLIQETGKPFENATYDFEMLPNCLRFFIEEVKHLDGGLIPDSDNQHINMIIRKPVGVVLGYLAWNFPILNLGYKLGPVLASGCTCVLKPSSQTPLTTMYIGEIANKAGIPSGVINMITGEGSTISKGLNESKIPSMITLIGSSETGMKIIEQSSTSIKKYSLELGGNAPVIVMKDADIEAAALLTADLKFGNAGQVCVSANRVFVHKDLKDKFVEEVKKYTNRITLGSGKDKADILMGPMVSKRSQAHMQELVDDAVSKGAKVLCGGKAADRMGYFFEPTVLDNVTPNMSVYTEEIFGPIMPILTFDDNDSPKDLANDTIYGLAAYLYTSNMQSALRISAEIDSGSVCVNEPYYNYNLPHGGCKQSGVGKDCSKFSLEEYFYIQRITMKL